MEIFSNCRTFLQAYVRQLIGFYALSGSSCKYNLSLFQGSECVSLECVTRYRIPHWTIKIIRIVSVFPSYHYFQCQIEQNAASSEFVVMYTITWLIWIKRNSVSLKHICDQIYQFFVLCYSINSPNISKNYSSKETKAATKSLSSSDEINDSAKHYS